MRNFNDREKYILSKIASAKEKGLISVKQLLESFFFKEEKGRALIIQLQSQYAVYFLRKENFDDQKKKEEEIEKFLELILLINYLKISGYIAIYGTERSEKKTMFFIQDSFIDPLPSTGAIILNVKGDYTSSPNTIHNKNKEVIYNGIMFERDTFKMIFNNTIGTLYISPSFQDLVNSINTTPSKKKKATSGTTFLFRNIIIVILLIVSFSFTYLSIRRYEDEIKSIGTKYQTLEKSLGNISLKPQRSNGASPILNTPTDSSQTIKKYYGIDISKWQGNIIKDIDSIDDHLTFVICKSTEGILRRDPYFISNWNLIKKKNLIRGAYHFYHNVADPIHQANFFLSTVQTLEPTDIAPIVDIEEASLSPQPNIDKINIQSNLLLFLKTVHLKTQRLPIIYSNLDFADKYLSDSTFSNYPLWLAHYTDKPYPTLPQTWKKKGYKIWQQTDSYSLKSAKVDFDIFYGKISDLYE